MFKKILVANRGEIACRIFRTAKAMGIKTVAVYSDADARALHVECADEKVGIGPAAASESYLDMAKIIAACKLTGAEAVHPGYGFLSERATFAQALVEAGLVFIGPNPAAIDTMGDKIESKKVAAAAGVSVVPGHMGVVHSSAEAVDIAVSIGFPVMIKASAGGGGKGMRIANTPTEVREGFERASSEAKSSFGDDRIFIEKFITNPRHIEIQVLGDKHGNLIHLGERECSIQRRNQKVVEESPSPLLDEKTRKLMGQQAIALARSVGYDSAGTVEFVVGQDRSFYFLEMNTRLQVEHPVTELVTGVDIVEQMIRVAAGEKLAIKQGDVKLRGSAIECRIYAEDPSRSFMPSTGRLTAYRPPAGQQIDGVTIRNDTGVYEGGEISIWYDPMIAKLCVHGPDRATAIRAMSGALDGFVIEGIRHNTSFLSAIMENSRWQSGELSTGFITEEFGSVFHGSQFGGETASLFAEVATLLDAASRLQKRKISGQLDGRAVQVPISRCVLVGQSWHTVSITPTLVAQAEGCSWSLGDRLVSHEFRGKHYTLQVKSIDNGYRLSWRGIAADAIVYSVRGAELARIMPEKKLADMSLKLVCPMPGLVHSILVKEGQEVKAGEVLAIVEAMKMENVLRAERDVRISKIKAKKGDSLAVDAIIMEFG